MTGFRRLTDSALFHIYITFGKTAKDGEEINSDKYWEKDTYWKCFQFLNWVKKELFFWQFQANLYHQLFSIVAVFVISEVLALHFVYLWRKN